MEPSNFLGEDPYLDRQDKPHVRPDRPLSQGDVFVDIPLLRAAQPSAKRANQLVAPVPFGLSTSMATAQPALTLKGLAALFHRLALNDSRLGFSSELVRGLEGWGCRYWSG
jgi:hypothetical protein